MEAALEMLLDRMAIVEEGSDILEGGGLSVACVFRLKRVCTSWHRLVEERPGDWWTAIGWRHLGLKRGCTAMHAHMCAQDRCHECGRIRSGRPCRASSAASFGRIVLVCRRCETDLFGYRRLIDRDAARARARVASNGFRVKGRNIERAFRDCIVARWTHGKGGWLKTLYWHHQVMRAYE